MAIIGIPYGKGKFFSDGLGGQSSGDFADGTISRWREDCLVALDELSEGPLVLIGSSMGGWMALLTALGRKARVKGVVLIAPAPDFTEKLMWESMPETARADILNHGKWMRPNEYGEPYPITRELIEDGKTWNVLDGEIDLSCPLTIVQGMDDPDVPWKHALRVQNALKGDHCDLILIKDGEHRLSRDQDISRILEEVTRITELIS